MIKIFIGYDSYYPEVYEVCKKSIEAISNTKHEIVPLIKKDLEKELDLIKRAQAIDETVLKLFTTQAQAAVLQYIDVELGWAMSRSGKGNTRAINITVDGSVGASSEQEKSHPWDFPIRSGEFKRTGIQGRLTAVMEKTTRDILKKAASKDMGMIRASETIGEIMESDLAGVT